MKLLQDPVERLLYLNLAAMFALVLLIGAKIIVKLHNQVKTDRKIKQTVTELENDKAARDKIILNHLDCVASLLSQPNRGSVRIIDLQNCKLGP